MSFAELSAAVRAECAALENVEYRLQVQYLVHTLGPISWGGRSTAEVSEAVTAASCRADQLAAAAATAAAALGLPADSPLRVLAATAPEPWCETLAALRDDLHARVCRVQEASEQCRSVLARHLLATQDALTAVTDLDGGYGPAGADRSTASLLVDAAL